MPLLAERMSRFETSASVIMATRARELEAQGKRVIKLTTGEPDFPTPSHVKQAVVDFMARDQIGYTPINGTPAMRAAAAMKFKRDNGLDYALDQITVGSGTKQILFNAIMATVDQGDEVVIPAPFWIAYPEMVRMAGGTPVIASTSQNNGFKLRPEDLEAAITPKTKWFVLCSPGNPTGAVYSAAELRALSEVLLRHPQVWVLTDDVYEHLTFDGHRFATMAQVEPRLYDRTITCNGVSKAYSMTGWRCGFGAGPKALIAAMSKLQSQATAGVSAISQAAAVAALEGPLDFVRTRTADLQRRRDLLWGYLNESLGLACDKPEGAMYIFCSCAGVIGRTTPDGRTLETDSDFVMYLLDRGVAVVQGSAYGLSPYFRASFVGRDEDLQEGGRRVRDACAALTD